MAKYSQVFHRLLDKCKTVEWVFTEPYGRIRLASDDETCPMALCMHRRGVCDYKPAAFVLGLDDSEAWDIMCAADNDCDSDSSKRVRAALIQELKPRRIS
jgi:hypothetical protein